MNPLFFLGRVGSGAIVPPVETPSVGGIGAGLPWRMPTEEEELHDRRVVIRGRATFPRMTAKVRVSVKVAARGRATFRGTTGRAFVAVERRQAVHARARAGFAPMAARASIALEWPADVELADMLGLAVVAADFR